MPIDQTDPEFIAARDAAIEAALAPVRTETAAKLAELATKATAAETAVADARAELDAAKAGGEATAAELATLKAKIEAAEAKAAALEAKEAERQAAIDKGVMDSVPESLRYLLAGKTGADLKTAADSINGAVAKPPPGRATGDGVTTHEPTEAMLTWARSMGLGESTNPAGIVAAYNKIGPGRKLAATN